MADFGLAEAGIALSAIGTGVGAIGAISSANAQAAEANYQAQVAKNNQTIANQNAAYAAEAGNQAAETQGLKEREAAGALLAEEAASGTDVNSGSNVNLRATQEEIGQLDVETVRQNAALSAYGFRTQATGFGAEAELEAAKAAAAPTAGLISAGSTLIGGAGTLATKWRGLQTGNSPTTGNAGGL